MLRVYVPYSLIYQQGLTGSVALTPVSGSSVSITLPTGARLAAQQGIRAQRMTLTPQQQQQQQQLKLMMLKQQQRAQLQQQIQVRISLFVIKYCIFS